MVGAKLQLAPIVEVPLCVLQKKGFIFLRLNSVKAVFHKCAGPEHVSRVIDRFLLPIQYGNERPAGELLRSFLTRGFARDEHRKAARFLFQ